ncbi:MAG: 30S ribosomal protein S12 methylthiotransferase RimO [Lachnospiraceae bacterium]|nr:30S ribosomal protein S12 methylthiotransferase RimO [Lachnospiraceae bacterium]
MNVLFVSLGCDKNLVDSEYMLGMLRDRGYTFTDDETEADVIIINSCCFILDAKEESINTIIEMAAYRTDESERCRALIVTGCLAQRYADEIRSEIPEVDAVIGATAYDEIGEVLDRVLKGEYVKEIQSIDRLVLSDSNRIITTGGYYSYLKIAEGCSKHCTYCIIPQLRGHYRSVPMERLIKEATFLAGKGVKELILVAQETTVYGVDLYGEKRLPLLLKELCRIEGIEWIRIMYCYPEEITDELIDVISEEPKICHYIDMPIQHASDTILKRMGRHTGRSELTTTIKKLRDRIPDIALRTTLITGFPGENDDDQKVLLDFVEEMKFERLGVFAYSAEEGTAAAEMTGQISEELKNKRRDEVMELQQDIAFEHARKMTGLKLEVIIEGRLVDDDVYVARTYMDAPGIDGVLFLKSDRELMSGDMVSVRVTGANEYDLIGELCDESAK